MVKFICDGCGKEEKGSFKGSCWLKPNSWYSKNHEGLPLLACCKTCIKTIALKYNVTDVIVPF